jgi:hypothetical protein
MPPVAQPQPLSKSRLLIGEGWDEVNFFEALLAHLNIGDIQVEQYGGKNGLPSYLREFRLRPGNQGIVALGITRDTDPTLPQAFQSVCGALASYGLSSPGSPGQVVAGPPRVGVFLMPDNQRTGMLEDLCWDAVQTDPAIPCVQDYFQCISQKAGRQPNNLPKARMHAWLASQLEPDRRLGEAAKSGFLPWSNAAFATLISFIQNL